LRDLIPLLQLSVESLQDASGGLAVRPSRVLPAPGVASKLAKDRQVCCASPPQRLGLSGGSPRGLTPSSLSP
jgi:hypothetical protein